MKIFRGLEMFLLSILTVLFLIACSEQISYVDPLCDEKLPTIKSDFILDTKEANEFGKDYVRYMMAYGPHCNKEK